VAEFAKEIEKLRFLYGDIILGCTFIPKLKIYVRHLTELDNIQLSQSKSRLIDEHIRGGIPTEDERLKTIIETGEWSQENEERILSLKYIISDNEKNVMTLIPQQQEPIKRMIQENRKQLTSLIVDRRLTLGQTAQDFAEQDLQDLMLSITLFKDKLCYEPIFPAVDAVEALQDETIEEYHQALKNVFNEYTEPNIRKVSSMPFFINTFSYCKDDVQAFLKKPLSQATNYQLLLFSYGTRNINILSQAIGEPPELMDDVSPEKLVTWYDQQYSMILGRRNSSK
jgi:hypothetical protein